VSRDGERPAVAYGDVVVCPSCEMDFGDFADASEAQAFAAGHDDLHAHGACLGAFVVDVADGQDRGSAGRVAEAGRASPVAGFVDEDGW
jgi:hypothetical protein